MHWSGCILLSLALATSASPQASKPPHIFLVLIDDLGWGNVGNRASSSNRFNGSTMPSEAVTPNIDELTKSGIRLNRHYTYNYCSPSRASLQSGRLPVHVSFDNDDPTTTNMNDPISGFAGIPRKMTGIAERLKEAGYSTHMTGKWDAGMATWEHTPMGRGYDSFLGYYHHANDYYTQKLGAASTGVKDVCGVKGIDLVDLWCDQGPANTQNGTVYEEELFRDNTLEIISAHNESEPLFLFHSFHLIHTPLEVPESYEKKFSFLRNPSRRKYAAMVNYMDEELGLFVTALKDKGMWESTLMVVSSDNGGAIYAGPAAHGIDGGANNMPLKGGKLSDWEGGIRVNAFVSGGAVPDQMRNTELDAYVHIADWYATLCEVAGLNATDNRAAEAGLPPIDSVSQWPLLSGQQSAPVRSEMHISAAAYIEGSYKILIGNTMPKSVSHVKPGEVPFAGYWPGYGVKAAVDSVIKKKQCGQGCLYNIITDPYEENDIADQYPQVRSRLMGTLLDLNKGIFRPDRGSENETACEVGRDRWGGFYGPFVNLE